MNKIAEACFQKPKYTNYVAALAKSQIGRRRQAYSAVALFEPEDLEQEIWCKLFESNISAIDDFTIYAMRISEQLARRGDRKKKYNGISEIPVSQLCESEYREVWNKMYGEKP